MTGGAPCRTGRRPPKPDDGELQPEFYANVWLDLAPPKQLKADCTPRGQRPALRNSKGSTTGVDVCLTADSGNVKARPDCDPPNRTISGVLRDAANGAPISGGCVAWRSTPAEPAPRVRRVGGSAGDVVLRQLRPSPFYLAFYVAVDGNCGTAPSTTAISRRGTATRPSRRVTPIPRWLVHRGAASPPRSMPASPEWSPAWVPTRFRRSVPYPTPRCPVGCSDTGRCRSIRRASSSSTRATPSVRRSATRRPLVGHRSAQQYPLRSACCPRSREGRTVPVRRRRAAHPGRGNCSRSSTRMSG